jgi:hypothetical protein
MLQQLWRLTYRTLVVCGIAFCFVVLSEVVDLYLSLREFNGFLAGVFAAAAGSVALFLAGHFVVSLRRRPKVLVPPPRLIESGDPRPQLRYLSRYLERLSHNPNLSAAEQGTAGLAASRLAGLAKRKNAKDLIEEVRAAEQGVVEPLLATLRMQAEAEVRRSVRDVMLGVALSGYRSADVVVVLYRCGALVIRLTGIYMSRPAVVEQLRIGADVVSVVAAVNLLNLGGGLLERLCANIPFIGQVTDDIAQGVGAGFLTSAAGHAAMSRCEAFKGWDREQEVASLPSRAQRFLADVGQAFTTDILRELRPRILSAAPAGQSGQPGFWDRIAEGIRDATEATSKEMDRYVRQPTVAAGRAVVETGGKLGNGVWSGLNRTVGRIRQGPALRGWRPEPRHDAARSTTAPAEGPREGSSSTSKPAARRWNVWARNRSR